MQYDDFFLPFTFPPLTHTIKEQDNIFLIGSCFTNSFARLLEDRKFNVLHNPFGTLFDPHSIAYNIISALSDEIIDESDMIYHDSVWHHFAYHSDISHIHKKELIHNIVEKRKVLKNFLYNTQWVFITYGTAWVYERTDNHKQIANCHKLPSQYFTKKLIQSEDIKQSFLNIVKALLAINPNIRFLLTISPVRHSKDGLIENNQSKSQLITAIHELTNQYNVFYFPAYELIIDVLRDYRFYERDKVHPNALAIEFVWNMFKQFAFAEKTNWFIHDMEEVLMAIHHQVQFPESVASQKFAQQMLEKCCTFEDKYPYINLQKEKTYFKHILKQG